MINRQDTGNTFKSIQTECLRLCVCNCLICSALQYPPPKAEQRTYAIVRYCPVHGAVQ